MTKLHSDRTTRSAAAWFDPETILYGLVGLLMVWFGARGLARWVMASWAAGHRALPSIAVAVTIALTLAALGALRNRRRLLYLGFALSLIGAASFLLASFGLRLPQSWQY
jgi:hypothetical protein